VALEGGGLATLGAPEQRTLARFPWHLGLLALAISALGVWNLASASRSAHAPVWVNQAAYMGIGVLAGLAAALVSPLRTRRHAWVLYAGVVALLVLVLWKGKTVMGARRWFAVGPLSFQPSEFAKIAVILVLARWFAADAERSPPRAPYGLRGLAGPAAVVVVPFALILREPDLGTALIVAAIGGSMILLAGVRWKAIAVVAALAVVGATAAWPHLKPYQRKRVETFFNPEGDVRGAGYHSVQSMIAVGSGQVFGKGWGQGTQTLLSFLPEQHTDFIFSVWAEEHGFAGCALLLLLYYALVASGITIAGNARDAFGRFVAFGATAMIFWHAFVNMGMVTGLLPVVGVTLPLMSYGGSSVLAVYVAVGLLAGVGARRFVN
jgi:rod shape determining protein RodA